jgi:hypothetical protein
MQRLGGSAPVRRVLVVFAMTAAGFAIDPMDGAVAATLCRGKPATIEGTAQRDVLVGTAGRDIIAGKGGSDAVIGRAGDDVICGESGADQIDGQRGSDKVFGDAGKDACYASTRAERNLHKGCEKHRAPPPPPEELSPGGATMTGARTFQDGGGTLVPGHPAGFFHASTTCFAGQGRIVSTIHVSQASTDPAYVMVRPWFSHFSSSGVWEAGIAGPWETFQVLDRSGSFDLNTYNTAPLHTFRTAHEWLWWDGSQWLNRSVTGWYKGGYALSDGVFVSDIAYCAT